MKASIEAALLAFGALQNLPTIVCLCGSTRFFNEFADENYKLTMTGNIVLSVGFFMHASGNQHGGNVGATDDQKAALDVLHLRKIDLADVVHAVNVGGYIGASTRRELWYASRRSKPITWREPDSAFDRSTIEAWFSGWQAWEAAAKPAAIV